MEKTNTFMTVVDVMECLEVSESKAYRIIRLLNNFHVDEVIRIAGWDKQREGMFLEKTEGNKFFI